MNFAFSENFFLLLIIPLAIATAFYVFVKKEKARKQFALYFQNIAPEMSTEKQIFTYILFLLGLSFLIFSMCGPQWGMKEEQIEVKGNEIFIAIDCSQSMMAEDYKPNRLEYAKILLKKLTEKLGANKIGVIAYAGMAYVECPLTTDMEAVKLFIEDLDYRSIPLQGTNIADAIKKAEKNFTSKNNKVIILLSDGENLEGNVLDAAKEAQKENIRIYSVGIGSSQGTEIIINDAENGLYGPKLNTNGKPVISKLDEKTLKEIASITNGSYIRASYDEHFMNHIASKISALEKESYQSASKEKYIHRYQIPLLAAFLLLTAAALLSERRKIR